MTHFFMPTGANPRWYVTELPKMSANRISPVTVAMSRRSTIRRYSGARDLAGRRIHHAQRTARHSDTRCDPVVDAPLQPAAARSNTMTPRAFTPFSRSSNA